MELDSAWIPDGSGFHVFYCAGVSVDTHVESFWSLMKSSQLSEHSNDISTTVLGKSSWDDLKSTGHGFVWPLLVTFNGVSKFGKSNTEFHLKSTSTWDKLWVSENVSSDTEGVMEVSLDLVKDIFRGTSEDDRASLWVFAVSNEREVIISNFLNLEIGGVSTNIFLFELFWSVDNSGTSDSCDSIVIGLSDSSNTGDVSFFKEEMLSDI